MDLCIPPVSPLIHTCVLSGFFCVGNLQDSSTSGANVKRLEAESAAAVKSIEKSIASKKKEVLPLPHP